MASFFIRPVFYDDFECTASKCSDTCCKGYKITIDKESYKKYKKIKQVELREKIQESIEVLPSKGKHDYATFKMVKNSCPMLDDKQLCTIQKNCGEKFLCKSCQTYPRLNATIGERVEMSLSLSCPEVAKLSLSKVEGIDFETLEDVENTLLAKTITIPSDNKDWKNYATEIRAFIILVLQERHLTIEERLGVIGNFLSEIELSAQEGNALQLISTYITETMTGEAKERVQLIDDGEWFGVVIGKLLKEMYEEGFDSSAFGLMCYQAVFGYTQGENRSIAQIKENYDTGKEMFYKEFFSQHDYLIENYLVMFVYNTTFPHNFRSGLEAFRTLVMKFLVFRLILIGNALESRKISKKDVYDYAYLSTRNAEQGDVLFKVVNRVVEELDINDFKSVLALIKY